MKVILNDKNISEKSLLSNYGCILDIQDFYDQANCLISVARISVCVQRNSQFLAKSTLM